MIDRRRLLATTAAAASVGALARPAAAALPVSGEAAKMNAMFDRFVQEDLRRSPEEATSLGFDHGELAWTKAALSEVSLAAADIDRLQTIARLAELRTIDRPALQSLDAVNYDVVDFQLGSDVRRGRLPYPGGIYPLSQLTGAYQAVPDFLDNAHAIETKSDADAYLDRMNAFASQMDGELELARHNAALGATPPDFILDKMLIQMRAAHDRPAAESPIVRSLARRAAEKAIPGDWSTEAGRLYEDRVRPALARQIAWGNGARATATHDAGVWRLKDGAEVYAASLEAATTSKISPEEVHRTGLDLVESHVSAIDALMKPQGLTQGTVGQRLRALYQDPKLQYANTDAAKAQLIDDLNHLVERVTAKLPLWFGALPKGRLEIRRVPKATEAGAPGGYYNPPPLDDSRPGIYWINLRDTSEVPRWVLPTLTFHEGVPGHHLQGSISNAAPLPLIRKTIWFSGYGEGWALYAEQLAVEMGMYEHDPLGHIGQLHDSLFRAVRLVVDSGIHAQRWSREQAVKYFVDTLGDQESASITEVERYCVWPGQACSYMVGKLTWLRLRDRARKALGPRFDIRKFHDAGLLNGATPLAVLERVIDGYSHGA